ncbi:hypothetical protein K353_06188 [Kitasatospora sp. SolWspMP-SS2h]|uniref:hypothetical protein n=1 Tax=Kitasatospora sp. SolWspMP-SS2h TaxID=1305729 RepID=UPI000DBA24E6|nr:hypothetical protein [Kitasatospora sp. SolWspMP-SS2h]RAJ31284.1 hypothetical protein K353_06188 [Kitasatospora sp. SolWspMP-SS2h]
MARKHNLMLRQLVAEADWSGADLARHVNRLGRENGMNLHYQRASSHQWMDGTLPRGPVGELVAEALSRRLGRRITLQEAGLAPADGVPAGAEPHCGISPRSRVAPSTPYVLEAPEVSLLTAPGGQGSKLLKISRSHVACVARMADHLSRSDHLVGSGSSLSVFDAFYRVCVHPWLDAHASPGVRRDLLGACARFAYIGGYLYVDAGRNGTAQQWYHLAAALAQEGGQPPVAAAAWRAMSVQAGVLGHHDHALALAERSLTALGARTAPPPFLRGQLAAALASCRLPGPAYAALAETERAMERESAFPTGSMGVYHVAAFTHQRAEIRLSLGDPSGAVDDLSLSARLRPPAENRTRALVLARLGEVHFARGEVEQACAAWRTFLDNRRGVTSERVSDAQRAMRFLLHPHRSRPLVADLLASTGTR